MSETRWLGVGQSSEPPAFAAAEQAAIGALRGPDPKLLLVFCAASLDLQQVTAGVRAAAHAPTGAPASAPTPVPIVGCSTAGEIATDGPGDGGVVVLALGGPGFRVAVGAAEQASSRLREAGTQAAGCFEELAAEGPDEHRILLLLTDGLAGDQLEIVRGAYDVVGAEVPLVGGCAGDGLRMKQTLLIHDDRVLADAVIAVAIASDAPFGIGVRHGWRRVGEAMLVTASHGNRVHTLDDEPALDVYLRRLAAPEDAYRDPEAFTQFALTHPLGLSRRSGEEVRMVADADFDDRSIGCIAQVPQGGYAWMMEGDDSSVLAASDAACADALAGLGGHPPSGLIAFDCIARRGVLGDVGIRREIDRVVAHASGAPVAGFYTYGEIARTRGTGGFHNQTLVVLAIG
ncbi:MAG TPA: FIST N-terminal domain-containing protein [Mycobacteriales bacterium]|nr:FIST N-terminal domain-containing protein [Mycobacteriales bacterium]